MRILLTGVEWDYVGTIAPYLRDYLQERKHEVVTFTGDIREEMEWNKYHDQIFDFIIHLAARSSVRPSMENPNEWEDINVNGTKQCFKFAKRNNHKVLYASTSNAKEWWLNPYATTKRIMEHMADILDLDSIGFRFHNIWPGRDDMIVKRLQKGESLPYINCEMYRDFTHIEDLSSAILTIMENYDIVKSKHDVVDIGTGDPQSVCEVIKHFWTNTEVDAETLPHIKNVDTTGERWHTEANVQYLLDLGWKPKHNIFEDFDNE